MKDSSRHSAARAAKRSVELSKSNRAQALTESVRALIRQLDKQLSDGKTCQDMPTHDVLLDIEVDEVRCLVIKTSAGERRHQVLLSPREREIVRMVALGHPNKVIAAVLDISCWTVGTYIRRIFAKLGVASRAAMVARVGGESEVPAATTARPREQP